ncbi:class II aldolase/adducin family protein [Ignisphaera aggregans DSM 17230]|uniref:Class II aldolase/adducin family protein n=1 Tax=Ignisphaera aggregans (strain DSM 17230 / JCM 13409 / AQ1.S1) TaxID=583356 RepID=E0SRB7_IGNAA|nr:class II aldolase/adducin family protein [Ignisphaera aggregans DSM 17230]
MGEKMFRGNDVRRDIVIVTRNLYRRGLVSALTGNVSARCLNNPACFWITPSGIFKGGLRPEYLVKLDLDGNILEGFFRPSIEWRFHAAIYRVRQDVNAVIHAHNPLVNALALAGIKLDVSMLSEVEVFVKGVEYIEYIPPGSVELAKAVGDKASTGVNAIILEKHGIIALGRDIYEAETIAEALEDLALAHLILKMFGRESSYSKDIAKNLARVSV